MNWEAFLVIGGFTLILGAVLLVPGLIWARIKVKQHPDEPAGMSVTRTGYVFFGSMLVVLLAVITSQFWAPESSIGLWAASRSGRFLLGAIVVGAALLIELVLAVAGIKLKVLEKRK